YVAPGEPAVVLDIFDMGTSADAFGAFTLDRDGEPLEVGEDGLSREGWVRFWKGRFFVSIYAERETVGAPEAALGMARAIEAGIQEKGERPEILGRLPKGGLQKQSIRYLHSHILLETHVRLSDENVLGLGPETEVVLASYVREGKRARLLLVSYPDAVRAAAARKRYLSLRPAGGASKEGIATKGGKWWLSAQAGWLLAIVLDADSRPVAESLLKEAETLPGRRRDGRPDHRGEAAGLFRGRQADQPEPPAHRRGRIALRAGSEPAGGDRDRPSGVERGFPRLRRQFQFIKI
ncbi:MAG: DUF6599 family protein, partial [Candidatus Deferrimicrobiaceae bacterium]